MTSDISLELLTSRKAQNVIFEVLKMCDKQPKEIYLLLTK